MEKFEDIITSALDIKKSYLLATVGFGTFFFGFFAGAIAGWYLLSIHSALVAGLRTSLNFKSAIFGDGVVLPIANMIAASFLVNQKKILSRKIIRLAFLTGALITVYFHVNQAVNKLVNWSMPTPWHWNILGLWHAIYMFSVCTFLSGFYFTIFRFMRNHKRIPYELYLVTFALILFFVLLRLDYISVTIGNMVLR